MILRPAVEADLPALTDIYNAAVTGRQAAPDLTPRTPAQRREWWRAHEDPRFPILAAEESGVVLGYAALSSWVAGDVYAHTAEAAVYLSPGEQGRGLGRQLLEALLVEAARRGHHVVVARVWADNAASLALCRRCGFQTVGVQSQVGRRHGVWEDCVLLQRILYDNLGSGEV